MNQALHAGLIAPKCRLYTAGQERCGIELAEDFDQSGGHSGPAGLVAGSNAGTLFAVEVLLEKQIGPATSSALELFAATEDRAPSTIGEKDARQPSGDLFGNLEQVHQVARARGAFDL